jgi:cysteinyl-tRNA synthetase
MLKLFNTLSGQKEEFKSIEKGKVKIYTCGPTVYDYAHIGNLSAYLHADTLRRYLEAIGYEIRHIVNITDVGHLTEDDLNQADTGEDKMLKATLREKKTCEEIADFYTQQFFEDVKVLNIKKANYYPRATAHVPQMIEIISTLIKKGLAYESNGNVFYDVEKFEGYGKLSGKKLDELKSGARLEEHPDKKKPYDFALWLKAPKEHILKWESPWSTGYPGWHIECSAMSMEYLGETLDIHTGGEDHIFPHHENEIAQSEGCTTKPFAHFWFHNRFLLVDAKKMSKSKGNFYTLESILAKGFTPMDFRMLIISSHYRSSLNFTWDGMAQAKKNLEKISRFVENIKEIKEKGEIAVAEGDLELHMYESRFFEAMNDDLNTPKALGTLFELITQVNKNIAENKFSLKNAGEILAFWDKINKILGLVLKEENSSEIPKEIIDLAEKREQSRKEKDFKGADEFRKLAEEKGFQILDTPAGFKILKS